MRIHQGRMGAGAIKWICVVAILIVLAAPLFWLKFSNDAQEKVLTELRLQAQDVERLRKEAKEVTKLRAQLREVESLRRELQELPALRNQAAQLRQERDQNAKLQEELQQLRGTFQEQQQNQAAQVQQLRQQQQQMQLQASQGGGANPAVTMMNTCVAYMKQLDGATQQWALETKGTSTTRVVPEQIAAYLRGGRMPVCPGKGTYVFGLVRDHPQCTVHGKLEQPHP